MTQFSQATNPGAARVGRLALAFLPALVVAFAAGCGRGAHAASEDGFQAVPNQVTRLVFEVGSSFEDFQRRYEEAVPAFSPDKIAGLPDWEAVVARTGELAPHGFLVYGKLDASPVMRLNGHHERAVTYLMGNHTVAETMYGKTAGVMLYAPLRTVLYEQPGGQVRFAIDQPSTRFSSFGDHDIAATGKKLDAKLAGLLRYLDLPVHQQGITAVPARRRATTRTNPAGLTSREVEVLGLLAQGLTNAEVGQSLYISAKTVDHHVSAILAKLQVANRHDAVHRAQELGLALGQKA